MMKWNGYRNPEGFSEKFAMVVAGEDKPPEGFYLLRELRALAKAKRREIDAYYRGSEKFVWAYRIMPDGKAVKQLSF